MAASVWLGVGMAGTVAVPVPLLAAGAIALVRRATAAAVAIGVVGGLVVGMASDARSEAVATAAVPEGRVEMIAVATADPWHGARPVVPIVPIALREEGGWARWPGPSLLLVEPPPDLAAGEPVLVVGVIEASPGSYRGRPIAGVVELGRSRRLGPAPNRILALGNVLRRHVLGSLDEVQRRPAGALLAGFLIGDVSQLPPDDADALRRAGLSHFVAVSGSNVALFLTAWWLAGGPLGMGPRRRAVYGMAGIVVFAIVTRWEPSVVRASVMAGLVLAGRWAGRPITPWTALGGAALLSLLVAPGLAGNAGFGLSVAATGGILLGAPLWAGRRPAALWTVLGATISAQAAVAPLLLMWFGSVPLMAPLANLLAAPLVSLATAIGGVGAVAGSSALVETGTAIAELVLGIARTAEDLPQLGVVPTVALGLAGLAAVRAGWLRPVLAAGVAVAVAVSVAPPAPPAVPTAHFLDVGQGDATLFLGPAGEAILFDGGPDPELLRSHLRRYGVRRIDLLVISHRHADHTAGLLDLPGSVAVGMVWHPPQLGEPGAFDEVVALLRSSGSSVVIPSPGDTVRVGEFLVEALAPRRRYAGPNDGSIVAMVHAAGAAVLMSGDVETHAQRDLGPLPADVMKVPHQGAATSDLGWIEASAPAVAVVSVGPNDYGHPSPEVLETLTDAGSIVLRTDLHGTVTLPLDGLHLAASVLASGG